MRALPDSFTQARERRGRGLHVAALRLGSLGDVLRTVPAVRLLRRGLPEARLSWIVEDRFAQALDGHPDLDGVLVVPRRDIDANRRSPVRWPAVARALGRLGGTLRALRLDLVVDFHGNLRSGVIGLLSRAPLRIGYGGHQQKEGNRWFTTHRIPPGDRRMPRIERNLALVRALGLPADEIPAPELPIEERGRGAARELIARLGFAPRRYAVVAPGASASQRFKVPPAALLGAACDALRSRGIASLVIHGPGERALAEAVGRASGGAQLAPPTELGTLAALMREARLFVGGDSGPLHLACSVDCPVLGIFGPTDPRVNGPWRVPSRTVAPPGRRYTGVKREDRAAGFAGLTAASVVRELAELLAVIER